jgi:hypothetical protein
MQDSDFEFFARLLDPCSHGLNQSLSKDDLVTFDDMYQLRPEYQKKVLEKEIDRLKRNIQSLTDTLSDQSEILKQKEDELKKL